MSKKNQLAKASMCDIHALAREKGWISLNDQERILIELLRYTNYHGRNIVMDIAMTIRRSHPWLDGDMEANTSTSYPTNSSRFATRIEH